MAYGTDRLDLLRQNATLARRNPTKWSMRAHARTLITREFREAGLSPVIPRPGGAAPMETRLRGRGRNGHMGLALAIVGALLLSLILPQARIRR